MDVKLRKSSRDGTFILRALSCLIAVTVWHAVLERILMCTWTCYVSDDCPGAWVWATVFGATARRLGLSLGVQGKKLEEIIAKNY